MWARQYAMLPAVPGVVSSSCRLLRARPTSSTIPVAQAMEGGDWCLVLVLGDALADRLQARLRVHTWARARACAVGFHSALAVRRLAAARGDELAVEEEALATAGSVLASLDEPAWRPASPVAKAQVARAQAAIAGAPQHRWTLRELGQD